MLSIVSKLAKRINFSLEVVKPDGSVPTNVFLQLSIDQFSCLSRRSLAPCLPSKKVRTVGYSFCGNHAGRIRRMHEGSSGIPDSWINKYTGEVPFDFIAGIILDADWHITRIFSLGILPVWRFGFHFGKTRVSPTRCPVKYFSNSREPLQH